MQKFSADLKIRLQKETAETPMMRKTRKENDKDNTNAKREKKKRKVSFEVKEI